MSPRVTPENRIPDIVAAAVAVFSRKGYRLSQMDEIAREAGVSKATLYYYFKSKIQLFQYVLQVARDGAGEGLPPPGDTRPATEKEFLQMLRKRLKEGTELTSILRAVSAGSPGDLGVELREILEEIWDINAKNRVQIIMLEKSLLEFPELADVYVKFARGRLLQQIETYLRDRMNRGAIRQLHSVRATARFLMESLAWFGFKQPAPPRQLFSKDEALPDLVAVLTSGLRAER
jgi:AcrR family transcriptional regulator